MLTEDAFRAAFRRTVDDEVSSLTPGDGLAGGELADVLPITRRRARAPRSLLLAAASAVIATAATMTWLQMSPARPPLRAAPEVPQVQVPQADEVPQPQETWTMACPEWIGFRTPAEAMAAADLVVRSTGPATPAGTAEMFGGARANVYSVDVADVLRGDHDVTGDPVTVISTPDPCNPEDLYPGGDPLDAPGSLILFLDRDVGAEAWHTITPFDGVVPPADDGSVPDSWPAG